MKRNFIITSHGWSASNWLACSLNMHNQIICTHSAANVLPDSDFANETSGLKKNIRQFHKGYVARVNVPIDESYDRIQSYGGALAYGSVHLFRLRDIPVQLKSFSSPKHQYTIVNMVRNPVSLVWSGYGQFKELFRFDLNELHWTLGKLLKTDMDFVFELGEKYDLYIGDFEILAFLCACRVLESLRLDIDAEAMILKEGLPGLSKYNGTVLMEKLTTDKEYFSHLFGLLELGELSIDQEYLEKVFAAGKINKHNADKRVGSDSSHELYARWSAWQREAFLHFFHKYELFEPYMAKGYDLDFLVKKPSAVIGAKQS